MRTIAVANQKGGSGKTTTAVNLAAALAEVRQRVLLLDLDPQASASAWFGVTDTGRGLLDVFTNNASLASLTRDTGVAGVQVVPASPWLLSVESALVGQAHAETRLRRAVERLPAQWDWLLVDCPPGLGLLTLNALAAVREILVTVEASVLALAGLAALWQTVERVHERVNPELRIAGILACRVDARTNLARECVAKLRERFGPLVLHSEIAASVRLAEAPSFQQPITVYAPDSAGATCYRSAARELLRKGKRP